MWPAAASQTRKRTWWLPTGRSPTARTRRPSAASGSWTRPHGRRRWSGLPRLLLPAVARRKSARSCPTRLSGTDRTGGEESVTDEIKVGRRRVRLTHPDRVLFPGDGVTKRDLVEYYVA